MPEAAGPPNQIRPRGLGLAALTVAPLIALVVVAIVSVGHGYRGAEDNALTQLRVADIGGHWPQIGPFSRDGWSHPGPALFYALVLPFRVSGSHANGLLVGGALLNAVAISGMVLLARRRGGTALALLMALGASIIVLALGPEFLWNPWNPYVTVLPFGLAVIATWCVLCGDVWSVPLLAAVGTFCVQTHVGYVPLVAVLAIVAAVGVVLTRRSRPNTRLRSPLLVTAAILVVAWAPPLFQQVTADRGNLWAIWHYFQSGRAGHTLEQGFDVVTAQFSWNPGWLVGRTDINVFTAQPTTLSSASWPVWWLGLGAALAWSWMRGRRAARALGIVLVVTIAASILAIAQTLGPIYEYRLRFVWVLGMLAAVETAWALCLAIAPHLPRRWIAAGVAVAAIGVVGLSTLGVVAAASADPPRAHDGRVVAALSRQLAARLPHGAGVVVPHAATLAEFTVLTGVVADLEQRGIPVRLRDTTDDRLRFGDQRMLTNEPVRAEVRIAVDDQVDALGGAPCTKLLAYWGRVSLPAHRRAFAATKQLERDLTAKRVSAPVAVRRLARLARELPAAAIYEIGCPPTRP